MARFGRRQRFRPKLARPVLDIYASPGTITSDAGNGGVRAWANPGNAASSNDTYSNCTGTGGVKLSTYLKAVNFNPGIPTNARIDRIRVRIEKRAESLGGSLEDAEVKLVINGTVTGNNKAAAGNWSTTEGYVEYDYTPAEWGVSVIPADLNAATSGVVLSVNIEGGIDSAFVDHIQIVYSYTLVPGYSSTSDITLGGIDVALAATMTAPVFSATVAFALGGIDLAVAAEFDQPVFAGSSAFALGGIDLAAAATRQPVSTAETAFALGGIELAAVATYADSVHLATCAVALGGIDLAAECTFTAAVPQQGNRGIRGGGGRRPRIPPPIAAEVKARLGGIRCAIMATSRPPIFAGEADVLLASVQVTAACEVDLSPVFEEMTELLELDESGILLGQRMMELMPA